ncbi:MAG: 3-hydroxyacyl-[acyl-carrier-protein] dehydratase FabZ [Planctomycetes bacterium]|nr:3-hydroxyacyl-[acyl-carrier-protein] dehydratase FabZ [Planctomycetota bacterium]
MTDIERPSELDLAAVRAVLPHREPFLFIDRVSPGGPDEVVAWRETRADEPHFAGHFPGRPVMPGVLMVEAMAQCLLLLYWYNAEIEDLFFLARDKSRFVHPVFPGDTMRIVGTKVRYRRRMGIGAGKIYVGDKLCAESEITFASGGKIP